jgi:uncharacterized membrane protein YbhN (UPF0104 family)
LFYLGKNTIRHLAQRHVIPQTLMYDYMNIPTPCAEKLKMMAKRVGQGITVLAIVFIAWELHRQWGKINDWRPTIGQLMAIGSLALFYGATLIGLAYNWLAILNTLLVARLPAKPVLRSYTETQIAKYMPGNVMHFVSRHIYLKHLGIAHRVIVFATMIELGSQVIAAITAICIVLPFANLTSFPQWEQQASVFSPMAAGSVLLLAVVGLMLCVKGHLLPTVMLVWARGTIFMLFHGVIFQTILFAISGELVFLVVPVAILAWLIGFVTPGAPGGMGVREAVLVALLSKAIGNEDVLIAALLFRVVTTVGDLALYVFGGIFFALTPDGGSSEI